MTKIIEVQALTKQYRGIRAVDGVSFTVEQDGIYGLLGRNGAGKTTLMQLITGQAFKTAGKIDIYGENPLEHSAVLEQIVFIRESQRYPENFKVRHVMRAAAVLYKNWDANLASDLLKDFRLPTDRQMGKLSRGQASAVGVVVGIASRAPITIFDEPYLGMDAVARTLFYDRLLTDYAERPRTIILSTHLIDEVADLLDHVLVIDQGRIILDSGTEELRGSASAIEGPSSLVKEFFTDCKVLESQDIGSYTRAVVSNLSASAVASATQQGLIVNPVSLQQLIVSQTSGELTNEKEAAN